MRLLFLCSRNKLRSPTAKAVFGAYPEHECDSAGLNDDAIQPLDVEQVRWAEIIFVMEPAHRARLNRKFRAALAGKPVVCLNIPDNYECMDPALIALLEARVTPHLKRRRSLLGPRLRVAATTGSIPSMMLRRWVSRTGIVRRKGALRRTLIVAATRERGPYIARETRLRRKRIDARVRRDTLTDMNQPALLRAILDALNAELETALREAKESVDAATDPDGKAENKYDTRALESSYLARGQARRVDELRSAVSEFTALAERGATPGPAVAVGSLVILDTPEGPARYFLGPAEGGTEVSHEGHTVFLITPASPLGRKLIGKSAGDSVTLQPGRPAWIVRSVE